MADRKITDLTALAAGSQATGDLLTIVDVSEAAATDKNKKITVESLFKGIPSNVGIGTTGPTGSLSIASGTFQTTTPTSTGDDIVISGNQSLGMQFLTLASGTSNNNIYFGDTDDPDVGMIRYAHATNSLQFQTNASERMRIDSSGNVGIGVTSLSSSSRLTLLESAGNAQTLEIKGANSGGAGSQPGIKFTASSGDNIGGIFGDTNTDAVILQTGGSERMRIDSSGNVGIGTSSPTSYGNSQATLVIEDDTNPAICWSDTGQTRDWWAVANGSNLSFNYADGGGSGSASNVTTALSMANSGNVGIGTTSPSAPLDVVGNDGIAIQSSAQTNEFLIRPSSGSADGIRFTQAGGAGDRMVIDSSGNVGINRSAPDNQLSIGSTASFHTDANSFYLGSNFTSTGSNFIGTGKHAQRLFFNNASGNGYLSYSNTSSAGTAGNAITWAERLRIDSSGRVGIGTTSMAGRFEVHTTANTQVPMQINDTNNTSTHTHRISFRTGNTEAGKITADRDDVLYVTTSDYRVKENISELAGAIARVKQLNPLRFSWKTAASNAATRDGFLAHEAQTVVPEAVSGTHNEVDDDGNAVMQGIDQSKLVPLLTAALKEAIAKIETLETQQADLLARVTALEAG